MSYGYGNGGRRSPYYEAGLADGERDKATLAAHPGSETGPDQEKTWSLMYQRGYDAGHEGAVRHTCTDACKQGE